MRGLKKRRRIAIVTITAVALAVATALIGYALRDGVNYFRDPSQVVAFPPRADEVFRLGGLVEPGSLHHGPGAQLTFRVTDGAVSIPVRYTGILPDLFREGQGMIGLGQMSGDTFVARQILAKHDENYTPRELKGIVASPRSPGRVQN